MRIILCVSRADLDPPAQHLQKHKAPNFVYILWSGALYIEHALSGAFHSEIGNSSGQINPEAIECN